MQGVRFGAAQKDKNNNLSVTAGVLSPDQLPAVYGPDREAAGQQKILQQSPKIKGNIPYPFGPKRGPCALTFWGIRKKPYLIQPHNTHDLIHATLEELSILE